MTDQEWLSCADPWKLLRSLRAPMSPRTGTFFGCACCRLIWDLLEDERSRSAVEMTELFLHGAVSESELRFAAQEARHVAAETTKNYALAWSATDISTGLVGWMDAKTARDRVFGLNLGAHVAYHLSAHGFNSSMPKKIDDASSCLVWTTPADIRRSMCNVLRDLINNRSPLSIQGPCSDSAVRRLAEGVALERAFDRLPILADALEEAGCTDAEILNHCRQPGEHWRGCWVVDLILGRS